MGWGNWIEKGLGCGFDGEGRRGSPVGMDHARNLRSWPAAKRKVDDESVTMPYRLGDENGGATTGIKTCTRRGV